MASWIRDLPHKRGRAESALGLDLDTDLDGNTRGPLWNVEEVLGRLEASSENQGIGSRNPSRLSGQNWTKTGSFTIGCAQTPCTQVH